MNRQVRALLLIFILGLILMSCLERDTDAWPENGVRAQLRFFWWGELATHEKYDKLIQQFEQQHPDIRVEIGWRGLTGIPFTTYYVNTFFLIAMVIIGNIITCSMAAFAFARLQFTLRNLWFAIMLGTIMLPYHVVLIPQYILFNELNWINTYLPLIVPKFLATDAFFIFLMVQFIRGIPKELDQAAIVDGCNPLQVFVRILFPLLQPALVTTAIFSFIWTYNDFFSQLIYISNPEKFTIALGLRMFFDNQGESAWGAMFAMSVVSLLPVFIFFVLFQRLIIEGVSTTGLKG